MQSPCFPGRRIVFVATEDWFFASHFLPMARAAREMGLDVAVVARVRDRAAAIEATGARVLSLDVERRSLDPLAAAASVMRLAAILKRERPDIVHCIALRPILVGGLAARLAGVPARVFALTGLGLLGAGRTVPSRAALCAVAAAIRGALSPSSTDYLLENPDDARLLGLGPAARVTVVGGAGVDPDRFAASPLPARPPLRIALVARMLWSKGIDIAVEAVRLARARGADVSLSLYGDPDPSNRRTIAPALLGEWSRRAGVAWPGRTRDVGAVWREHHLCCLPSRGGEGLPRSLLEAASCGRAIVTTDVPGCRSFVRHGIDGLVVPPDDPAALAAAFMRLAERPDEIERMGRSARTRVVNGYTERHVMETVKRLYAERLACL